MRYGDHTHAIAQYIIDDGEREACKHLLARPLNVRSSYQRALAEQGDYGTNSAANARAASLLSSA